MPRIRVTRVITHVLTSTYNNDYYPDMTIDEAVRWETEQPLEEIFEFLMDGASEITSAVAEVIEDTENNDTENNDTETVNDEVV